jgi:DNA-binding SARP family transcriptional activator
MIRLRTLGECVIEIDDVRVQPKSQHLFAALLFLVLQAGQRITRQRLASVLWPDLDERRSLASLRQIVYSLRRLGVHLHWDPHAVVIAARDVDLDVNRELARYAAGSIDPEGPIGAFLTGYTPRVSPEFAAWIDGERARRHTALTAVYLNALAQHRARGRWTGVDLLARRCLACDPLNEEATLALAEAAAMTGRKIEALDIIDRYLAELEGRPTPVRLPAALLRLRIADRLAQAPTAIDAVFVGREEELAVFNGLAHRARAGHGGAGLLWGARGIGKARMAHEVGRQATLAGLHVVQTIRRASDVRRPLSLFADLTPVLQDLPGAIGCSPVTLRYLARLTGDDPGPVAGVPDPGDEGVPGYVLAAVRRALADLIAAVSEEQPLLFIIEHAHYLDQISTEILSDLIAELDTHHIAVLLTAPTPFPATHPLHTDARNLVVRELHPLSPPESERLLHALIHNVRGGLDPETVARYTTLADGNPYFLRELAVAWMYYGEYATVPDSLTSALDHRVSTLSETALRVLQSATLLGPNSTFPRLERSTHLSHLDLLRSIDELHAAGLLRPAPGPVLPRHDVVAEAATRRLTPMAALYLHRRIAMAMEQDIDQSTYTTALWDCAQHYVAADDNQMALDLIGRCCDKLFELNLARETLELWTRARELCRTDEQHLHVIEKLISTNYALDDLGTVVSLALEMEDLRLRVRPSEYATTSVILDVLEARTRTVEGHDAEELYNAAFGLLSNPTISSTDRARAGANAMVVAGALYDRARLCQTYLVLRSLSHRSQQRTLQQVKTDLIFQCEAGDLATAVELGAELVVLARSGNSFAKLAQALRFSAKPLGWLGQFDTAREALLEALEIADRLDSGGLAAKTLELIARTYLQQGDIEAADIWGAKGIARIPASHHSQDIALQHLRATNALIRGDVDAARQIAKEGNLHVAPSNPRSRFSYYMLAVQTLIASLTTEGPVSPEGTEFLRLFGSRQSYGDQDTFAYCAHRILRSAGQTREAAQLLNDYQNDHRRERSPLPNYLALVATSPG